MRNGRPFGLSQGISLRGPALAPPGRRSGRAPERVHLRYG
jgi:hypothetical protein